MSDKLAIIVCALKSQIKRRYLPVAAEISCARCMRVLVTAASSKRMIDAGLAKALCGKCAAKDLDDTEAEKVVFLQTQEQKDERRQMARNEAEMN